MATGKDGTTTVMGTPTDTAILEFRLGMEKHTCIEHAAAAKLRVDRSWEVGSLVLALPFFR